KALPFFIELAWIGRGFRHYVRHAVSRWRNPFTGLADRANRLVCCVVGPAIGARKTVTDSLRYKFGSLRETTAFMLPLNMRAVARVFCPSCSRHAHWFVPR